MVSESIITKEPLVATVKMPSMLPLNHLSVPPKMQLVRFASESIWNAAVPLNGPVMPHGGHKRNLRHRRCWHRERSPGWFIPGRAEDPR